MAEPVSRQRIGPSSAAQASGAIAAGARHPGLARLVLPTSMVMSFLAASSAPTPLYATYAQEWHFSPITTTVVFGAYAIAVLLALLVFGRVSDYAGRRPVLLAALAVQIVAAVVLATAGGTGALLAGRLLQGLSTGGALGALGAAMLDVDHTCGALVNAAAPGMGTGAGALLSGLLVQYVPAPTHVVYLVLIGVFVLQGIGVVLVPETTTRKPGLRAALVPELAVPRGARSAVLAAAPILFAVWALAGFYGSLGPALARQLSRSASAITGGLGFFLLGVAASLTTVALSRTPPRTVMRCGIAATAVAAAATLAAVQETSGAGFLASAVVAGIGLGAGLQGGFRTVIPLAPPRELAGLMSVIYVICYCGMGVPSVVAGILVVHGGGLISSARDYALFVFVLAAAALAGLLLMSRSVRYGEGRDQPPPTPREAADAVDAASSCAAARRQVRC